MTSGGLITEPDPITTARCLGCGYPLRGLADWRCPECGRAFDPHDPKTMRMPASPWRAALVKALQFTRPAHAPIGCIGLSWFLYLVQHGQWSMLFWLPAVYLGVRRRWKMVAVFLLLMPLTVEFGRAACDYARGTHRFVQSRSAYESRYSIRRTTRVRSRADEYDAPSGNEWAWRLAEDSAELVMFRLIGPPPGAYDGPYPTEAEARQAINNRGSSTAAKDAGDGFVTLSLGGRTARVDADVVNHWGYVLSADQQRPAPDKRREPSRVALVGGRCAVLAYPHKPDCVDPLIELLLIDMNTGNIFARYIPDPPMPRTAATQPAR